MLIPLAPLIIGVLTWTSTKALPALWQHHTAQPSKVQVEFAKDLCNKGDCEAEKAWAMQGLKPQAPVTLQEPK